METDDLVRLVDRLMEIGEAEWIEFKRNVAEPAEVGEYISAISNAAALHGENCGFIVWGVDDAGRRIVGTSFKPRAERVGSEELENWLCRLLTRNVAFRIHEFEYSGLPVVLFEVPAAVHTPVGFKSQDFIRVGTYKKNLRDYPERARQLWASLSRVPFENEPAEHSVPAQDVLGFLDYPSYFELVQQPLPDTRAAIIERLQAERFIRAEPGTRYTITNLGRDSFCQTTGTLSKRGAEDGAGRSVPRAKPGRDVART